MNLSSTLVPQVVPTAYMTITSSLQELELLFSLMFDEYFIGDNQVVSRSFTVTDKRQQHHTTPSTSTIVFGFNWFHAINLYVVKYGLMVDGYVRHSLISMYARCGELGCARKVFDEIADRDLVSWNSMIFGCVEMGFAKGALELFKEMKRDGFEPDDMTVVSVLGACEDLGDLGLGNVVEEYVGENEMEVNSYVGYALIDMYNKCGYLVLARRVFYKIGRKDLVTWNVMITGFVRALLSGNQSSDKEMGALLPIASESRFKLAAVNENENQYLQWFFDACKGIPQWPLMTCTLHTCSGHIPHTIASSPRMFQKKQPVQGFGPPSETKRVAIATPTAAEAEPKEEVSPKRPPVGPKGEAKIQRISLTGFPAQSVGSSNTYVSDSPCLLVLITETSQSRQHDSIARTSSSSGVKHLIPSRLTRYLNLSSDKALVNKSANCLTKASQILYQGPTYGSWSIFLQVVRPLGVSGFFKKNTDVDGIVHVYKARLLAKGYTQLYGVDYKETFSPVADIRAIRILISIVAYYDYEIWQMDVKTTFLNGYLDEDIYMVQPEGFVDPNHPRKVGLKPYNTNEL
ncbi:pentatricopeptide repeat-containing protein [Tanacetum coccineum]|uniref:Pentatricopeptide repeat-containing protein n=1 Tax=Tanacetum coccineum TaxID=301880 RepID=A0ABQ4WSS6_9ASTR